MKQKIIRASTVPLSIKYFVEELLPELMKKYEVLVLSSPGQEVDDVVAKYGVRGIAVPMERHISLKNDIVSLWRLIKVFCQERPTMVHSITPKAGLLCMIAAKLARVPVRVHTFTGLVFPTSTGLKRRILMFTDWLTCACATHIIPEGNGVMEDLRSHGITKKPMRVLGYGNVRGIDLKRFDPKRFKNTDDITSENSKTNTENSTFTFLFVGRIVGDKGINELLAAFQRLNDKNKNTQLILVGWFEKELDPVSEETQKAINEHPCIHAVGTKEGDELLAYYAAADCYVFPSYREGFPNTVLEAGAMGLPCIVTDINGSREIIVDDNDNDNLNDNDNVNFNANDNANVHVKKNGIVIPPKDEGALYEAMKLMITDTEMRERMSGNARRMIAERYDQDYVRQCLLDFYDEILK